MNRQPNDSLASLYHADETAWLEETARLVAEGRFDECDSGHLSDFLQDMAHRDRREVLSRLTVLLSHRLKWLHQPDRPTGSWQATILTQREELEDLLESRTLRNHADAVLEKAYERAVRQAATETGLDQGEFSKECPWTIEELLAED